MSDLRLLSAVDLTASSDRNASRTLLVDRECIVRNG